MFRQTLTFDKHFHPLPSDTMQLPLKILRFQATLVVGAKQETTEQQLSLPRSSSRQGEFQDPK